MNEKAELPDPDVTLSFDPTTAPPNRVIGRYELLEKIGEGGMGEVWVAKQSEPVKRKVALKLIKQGMDSRSVIARFDQERQALAVMDHPNIAKVLDGGLAENGQPYFVMELVSGQPLVKFCDREKLSIRQRLELFVPICQAVQHAHQKGVIHRDLKPSNILVSLVDGRPVPKVIDFGLAKAVTGKLTDESLSTHIGAVVGTLEYMAPEQAGVTSDDIDTRADVYSLGVILYELLTGLRPFDLRRAAYDEMIRVIREVDPPSLASRLSTDESLPSTAAVRATEPKRLVSAVKGELDWIARRCLEKDRNRRYETANALGRDLQRYLADEPVEARPASAGYRLKKFLRRNKGVVVAASLILVSLVASVVLVNAERVRTQAQRDLAQTRLEAIASSNQTLLGIFNDLNPLADENVGKDYRDLLADRLVQAASRITAETAGDPIEAEKMRIDLGRALIDIGRAEAAFPILTSAHEKLRSQLGDDAGWVLRAQSFIGDAHGALGRYKDAASIDRQTLETVRRTFPDDVTWMCSALERLGLRLENTGEDAAAKSAYQEAIEVAKSAYGPDDWRTLRIVRSLAHFESKVGRPDVAAPLMDRAFAGAVARYGREHAFTLMIARQRAGVLRNAGRANEATSAMEECLRGYRAIAGPDHPATLKAMNELAECYRATGKTQQALELIKDCYARSRRSLGSDHPDTLVAGNDLAAALYSSQDLVAAAKIFEELLPIQRLKSGNEHIEVAIKIANLGAVYLTMGDYEKALPFLEESAQLIRKRTEPKNDKLLSALSNLAAGYYRVGRLEDAIRTAEEALQIQRSTYGVDSPNALTMLANLGVLNFGLGRYNRYLECSKEAHERSVKVQGADHPDSIDCLKNLTGALTAVGRHAEAEDKARELVRRVQARDGPSSKSVADAWQKLASCLHDQAKASEAVAAAKTAAEMLDRLKLEGQGAVRIAVLYGRVLDAERRFDEAEKWHQRAIELATKSPGAASADYAVTLIFSAQHFLLWSKPAEAEAESRKALAAVEALATKRRMLPWRLAEIKSILGGSLFAQGKVIEAEQLLKPAYESLKANETTIPAPFREIRLTQAVDRLIELYTATNKPEEVKKWKAEREKYVKPAAPTKK